MSDYTTKLTGYTYNEVYAQFYESIQAFIDMWQSLPNNERKDFLSHVEDEDERIDLVKKLNLSIIDIRSMPKKTASLEEALSTMMPIVNRLYLAFEQYLDKYGIKLAAYLEFLLPYLDEDAIEQCHCTDGCMVPIVVVKTKSDKLALYGNSEVRGMGNGLWHKKITNEEYDKIVPYNSYDGISHIAVCKNDKWGLIELRDNDTAACEWKFVAEITYTNLDDLIKAYKIYSE